MDRGISFRSNASKAKVWKRALAVGIAAAILPVTWTPPASAITNPLLSAHQMDSADLTPFTKWTALLPRYEMQRDGAAGKCIGKNCLNQQWEELLQQLRHMPVGVQIDEVNNFFNAIPYVSDQQNYGVADYWQTPYELMQRGGDCEDYAIAKYISLKRLGVLESAMRILIVKDTKVAGPVHAVLEIRLDGPDADAKILDNQVAYVVPATKIQRYRPVFAINESKWWSYEYK